MTKYVSRRNASLVIHNDVIKRLVLRPGGHYRLGRCLIHESHAGFGICGATQGVTPVNLVVNFQVALYVHIIM